NAVNMPALGAEDLEALGPFVPLASKLGRLAMELAEGRAEHVTLSYFGGLADHDARVLTVAALRGILQGRVEQAVNFVNAPLIASEQGIDVREEIDRGRLDFTNLLSVRVQSDGDEVVVSGTTIGGDDRHWLASALGFEIEIELAPLMVFFRYDDVPGVIGRVGTMFGDAGINIANMTVSRTRRGDKALMAFSIDSEASPELVERMHGAGFDDAWFIRVG